MPSNTIKSFAKKTGKSEKEVEKMYQKASKEAEKMGQKDNYSYITAILKTMLGLEESIEDFTKKYIESDKNFNEFYEMLTGASIGQNTLPDEVEWGNRKAEDPLDKDDEGKKKKIVKADAKMLKDLEKDKDKDKGKDKKKKKKGK